MKLLALIICLVSFQSFGQGNGYFGRKNVVEFSGHGSFPLFSRFADDHVIYKETSTGSLVKKSDVFDGGFFAGISHAVSNTFGIGLEMNYDFQNIQFDDGAYGTFETQSGYQYTNQLNGRFEHIDTRTSTFLFKLEFSGRSSLLPVGISHQLGFGRSSTRIVEKDYQENYTFNSSQTSDSLVSLQTMGETLNYDRQYKGIMIMYKVNYRTPVSKRVVLNYGIRFTVNVPSKSFASDPVLRHVRRDRFRSVAQLYLGTSFVYGNRNKK